MTAILGGLGAAISWACATLCSASSSRRIGIASTLAWVVLSGIVVSVPIAAATGWPEGLDGPAAGWLAASGATNVAGLAFVYAAVRRGEVGVVASLVSTEGAIAALIAIAAGERPAVVAAVGFLPMLIGVALVAIGPSAGLRSVTAAGRTVLLLTLGGATSFGVSLFTAGQASESVPIGWVALPARVIGVAILLGALATGMRPLASIRLGRIALLSGVLEVSGILCFAWGARESIAITSVMASQFAALTALGAFLVFRERLVRRQLIGVAAIAVGVAMVALGSA